MQIKIVLVTIWSVKQFWPSSLYFVDYTNKQKKITNIKYFFSSSKTSAIASTGTWNSTFKGSFTH